MRIIIAALALALVSSASAQTTERTYRDSSGREIGRSSTDARGNTTFYDASGRNTGRASNNGTSTTTVYDPNGRQTGTIRSNPK